MKLSHYDHEKDLIRSQDLADYYSRVIEGIKKDVEQAIAILNPLNGRLTYRDRLLGCSVNLTQIAMHLEEMSEEF